MLEMIRNEWGKIGIGSSPRSVSMKQMSPLRGRFMAIKSSTPIGREVLENATHFIRIGPVCTLQSLLQTAFRFCSLPPGRDLLPQFIPDGEVANCEFYLKRLRWRQIVSDLPPKRLWPTLVPLLGDAAMRLGKRWQNGFLRHAYCVIITQNLISI